MENPKKLETVRSVDLKKYSGKWYEIAALPTRFEKNCKCTSAGYELKDDYVKVINRCYNTKKEKWEGIEGKAFPVKNSSNSKLNVQFFWPFKGKYWIIKLADDYSYAIVGHPKRKYLWILSRSVEMDNKQYQELLQFVKNQGYDISKIKKTSHNCDQTN